MKKLFLLLAIASLIVFEKNDAFAQPVFDHQNLANLQSQDHLTSPIIQAIYKYYLDHKYLTPSEAELRDMPRTTSLPSNMEEIYYDHVWLNIAEYCWLEGGDYSDAENTSVALRIPDRKNGEVYMLFDNLKDQYRHVIDARAQRGFDHKPVILTKVKNHFYFVAKSELNKADAEYQAIVDYHDGLLTYENTYSGKPGDFTSFRRFRFTALAIPKSLLEATTIANMPVLHSDVPLMQFSNNGGWTAHVKPSNTSYNPVVEESYSDDLAYDEEAIAEVYVERPTQVVCAKPAVIGEMLSEEKLRSLRPGQSITSGLSDALYEYDWMEIGGLMWYQGESYWGNSAEAPVYRFQRDGGVKSYEINIADAGKKAPTNKNQYSDDHFRVVKRGQFTFISNGKEGDDRIEFPVLHYDGKILVYDEYDAVSQIRIRKVCKAVGKL